MKFTHVPKDARLFIYTHDGELVKEFVDPASSSGLFEWDGRNQQGYNVATGVYIAVIRSGYTIADNTTTTDDANSDNNSSFIYRVKIAIQR